MLGIIKYCPRCQLHRETKFFTKRLAGLQTYCRECRQEKNAAYRADPSKRFANRVRASEQNLRVELIAEYGGKCECCGEHRSEFLTIDHINNDGNFHRGICGDNKGVYRDIKKQGYPKDKYRCLCMNCNWARGIHGYCPHEKERRRV